MGDFSVQGSSVTLPNFNPSGVADGPVSVTHRGEVLNIPWYQAWINKGRVYQDSPSTVATGLTVATTSYAATTPVWMMDVPAGTTVIPISMHARQVGTVAGGVIKVILSADRIARYSSGGTAKTPINVKIGPAASGPVTGARASTCSVYTGATAAAVNTHIELFSTFLTMDVGASTLPGSLQTIFQWPQNPLEPLPQLVGPSSLLWHTFAGTTNATWSYRFVWLEVDS